MLLYKMSITQIALTKGKGLKKKVLMGQAFPSAWYLPYIQSSCFSSLVMLKKNAKQLKDYLKI